MCAVHSNYPNIECYQDLMSQYNILLMNMQCLSEIVCFVHLRIMIVLHCHALMEYIHKDLRSLIILDLTLKTLQSYLKIHLDAPLSGIHLAF